MKICCNSDMGSLFDHFVDATDGSVHEVLWDDIWGETEWSVTDCQ